MRNILVTGGSRGIGKYLTLYLAKQGNNLITCARNAERLEELKGVKNIKVEKSDIGDIEKIAAALGVDLSKLLKS